MSGGGFSDWSFEVVKAATLLLSHGAQFTYTADDAFNPSVDPNHPGMMFPQPGPGMAPGRHASDRRTRWHWHQYSNS